MGNGTARIDIPEGIDGRDYSTSLMRGLKVIACFDRAHETMSLSEVAARTAMPRAAARRFLLTLRALGYVEAEGRLFRLTPRVLELGFAYLTSMPVWERAQPHMERLVEQVNESCSVSVLEGTDIVYVARVPTKRIMSVALGIGSRLPAWCTSMGRVLLAGLAPGEREAVLARADIRALTPYTLTERAAILDAVAEAGRSGHCLVDQELEEGLRSLAVPLRGKSGRLLAAMNVSAAGSWRR